MSSCKLTIKDEVNIKVDGLSVETRRKIVNKLKFDLPYARHMPSYKLGRWDGTKTYFSIGGTGYLAHLDVILPIIEEAGYEIDVEDLREHHSIKFAPVTENYWSDRGKTWPKGHPAEGQPIVLRDYQFDVVNKFQEHPQSLQEVATGAGKTITTATLSHLCEPYGRTMVIVPNKSLVVQTEEDYRNLGLDVGVYFGDRKELNKTHTICTWQSLNVLDKKGFDDATLSLAEFCEGAVAIIVDECFDGDALVLTPSGYVAIKHIGIGDTVINYSEKTKQFKIDTVVNSHVNLTNTNSEKMYELEFDNGSKIQVTGNHKFLTNLGWCRADELSDHHEIVNKT